MENTQNSAIYKNDETSLAKFKNSKNVVAFRCRLNKEDCELWTKLFGKVPCKKPERERSHLGKFLFFQLEYNNNTSKDMVMYHGNVFAETTHIDEIKEILNNNFQNIVYKKNGKSISVSINYQDTKKGLWTNAELPQKKLKTITPEYPINIVSFGRCNKYGYTHKLLTKMKINHYLFIEKKQQTEYKKWYDPSYCKLIIGENYSEENMGSTPMRNYIMDYHKGEDYVWIFDDNIKRYNYFNKGKKNTIESPVIFKMVEDYVNGCDNIGIASHNFSPFIAQGEERPCIIVNSKCYSSMLLNNKIGLRFSHKHQEDNFISIDCICKGFNTLSFNTILYEKNTSGTDKGGNHDSIYKCGNKTDGEGYKERFEYFKNTGKELIEKGEINLKDGVDPDDFIWRDPTMKSKEYHAKAKYAYLKNYENPIIFNDNPKRCFDNYLQFIPK